MEAPLLILATRPWFTLAMIPLSIVAMLVITAVLVTATGSAKESQNQLGLQSLVKVRDVGVLAEVQP